MSCAAEALEYRSWCGQVGQIRVDYLVLPEATEVLVGGGFPRANRCVPRQVGVESITARLAKVLDESAVLVLDASERMRPEVESVSLCSGISRWVAGVTDEEPFAKAIDDDLARAGTAASAVMMPYR